MNYPHKGSNYTRASCVEHMPVWMCRGYICWDDVSCAQQISVW
jgi:hypothetical protein